MFTACLVIFVAWVLAGIYGMASESPRLVVVSTIASISFGLAAMFYSE